MGLIGSRVAEIWAGAIGTGACAACVRAISVMNLLPSTPATTHPKPRSLCWAYKLMSSMWTPRLIRPNRGGSISTAPPPVRDRCMP